MNRAIQEGHHNSCVYVSRAAGDVSRRMIFGLHPNIWGGAQAIPGPDGLAARMVNIVYHRSGGSGPNFRSRVRGMCAVTFAISTNFYTSAQNDTFGRFGVSKVDRPGDSRRTEIGHPDRATF